MNEHMWKKLGEVKAFAKAASEFLAHGKEGFMAEGIFSAEEIDQLEERTQKQIKRINNIADTDDASEIVDKKAEATGQKLADMQNRYLEDDDDWKDPMELLEWSGFFFGGAIVHWSLIRGASESVHNPDLTALAGNGFSFYFGLMETVTRSIRELARKEAE